MWNRLPAHVVEASSVNSFKKRLDDWSPAYIHNYYKLQVNKQATFHRHLLVYSSIVTVGLCQLCFKEMMTVMQSLTATVTEALVLRPLPEDRGRITESIRILVLVIRIKQKCFQITTKRVRRSQQFQLRHQFVDVFDDD